MTTIFGLTIIEGHVGLIRKWSGKCSLVVWLLAMSSAAQKWRSETELLLDIEAELLQEGLCWGLESAAFPRVEFVHEEDVLEIVVGELVDVDFSGQVAPKAAVDVLDGAQTRNLAIARFNHPAS